MQDITTEASLLCRHALLVLLQMSDTSTGDQLRQVEDTTAFKRPQAAERITAAAAEQVGSSVQVHSLAQLQLISGIAGQICQLVKPFCLRCLRCPASVTLQTLHDAEVLLSQLRLLHRF